MKFRTRHIQSGFTLMELMIVIAIIAIIVMLAIPAYQDYSIRAKVGESLAVAAAAKTSVTEACQTDPLLTPSNSNSGYSFTASDYVASVTIGGSCTAPTVQMTTKGTGATPDPVLILTGNFSAGAGRYDWTCARTSGSNKLVPARCRGT
jgi:type IV pilus assembly protein PilA